MATKQTAEQLYDERREDIARVMDWIECELDAHRIRAEASPQDWSNAGDLGHVLEKLTQTLAFLSNRDPEDIEALLSESRCMAPFSDGTAAGVRGESQPRRDAFKK